MEGGCGAGGGAYLEFDDGRRRMLANSEGKLGVVVVCRLVFNKKH